MEYMTPTVYFEAKKLIEDFEYRRRIGTAGLEVARSKFSVERRNKKMKSIYEKALG